MAAPQSVDDAGTTSAEVAAGRRQRRGRRSRWVGGLVSVLALAVALALSVVAGKPTIGVAAVSGLLILGALWMLLRGRRRLRWLVVGTVAVLGVVAAVAVVLFTVLGTSSSCCTGTALPVLTVQYHGTGRIVGQAIKLDEQIVLDQAAMVTIAKGASETQQPVVHLTGWQQNGLVDGYPAFARTRTVKWDHTSALADTARIPMTLGTLTAIAGHTYNADLALRDTSRIDVTLPKGAVGSTTPALSARTDGVSGTHEETITFALDQYVGEVWFDVLSGPWRNPAGHAMYAASLWGFWQWAAGAGGAVVSGLVVDKLAGLVWSVLSALFRRRRVPAAG
jgi:hypothetical protein